MPMHPVLLVDDELTVVSGYTVGTVAVTAVRQALRRLDEKSRALCELIGLEQLSYAEVSNRLNIPLGSVGPLYIRAKQKLRHELAN